MSVLKNGVQNYWD